MKQALGMQTKAKWQGNVLKANVLKTNVLKAKAVLPLSCAIAALSYGQASHAEVSQISAVTVYQGMASVTRALPVTATGEQMVVFSCLSPRIDPDSISVQAGTGVNLGEVSIQKLTGEQAKQCRFQGAANIQTQQQQLADIDAEINGATMALNYLNNLSSADTAAVNNELSEGVAQIESRASALYKRIDELNQQKASLQDQLSQSVSGGSTTTGDSVTQVSVRAASRTQSQVQLHYQVQGAGWEPTYQASLDTSTQQMTLQASAVVAQYTGENWSNVPLTLSTVNPSSVTSSPTPRVSTYYLQEEDEFGAYADEAAAEMAPSPVAAVSLAKVDGSAEPMPELPSYQASSTNTAGVIEYRLPQRVNVASDGRRVTTVLDSVTGNSELWLRSTPEQDLNAYWYASAPFLNTQWATGALQLYRDGNYVGHGQFDYQRIKEEGVGFGRDRSLIVKRLSDNSNEGESGVFNKTTQQTLEKSYQFTNLHERSVRLQVLGTEPKSANDEIKISTTHTPPVSETDWNDIEGAVAWEMTLAPQQSQTIKSVQQIRYPSERDMYSY